jgi:pimeloyl-ACP methyl ester carboxylesterase
MIAANRETAKRVYKILRTEKTDSTAARLVVEAVRNAEPKLRAAAHSPADSALVRTWLAGIDEHTKLLTRPWFRYLLAYEPARVLKQLRVPVLALYGGHDLQVPPAQNVPAMQNALRAGRDRDFTVLELPGLNHLFQNAPTGVIDEYARIEETFAPSALELISNWILERTRGVNRSTASHEFQRGE